MHETITAKRIRNQIIVPSDINQSMIVRSRESKSTKNDDVSRINKHMEDSTTHKQKHKTTQTTILINVISKRARHTVTSNSENTSHRT